MALALENPRLSTLSVQHKQAEKASVPFPAQKNVTVSVVVPALNEAENLPHVVLPHFT